MIGTFVLNSCSMTTNCLSRDFDFLIVDREHGAHSFERVNHLLDAMEPRCEKIIRVSHIDRVEIQRALELNPDGVLVPQVSGLEDVSTVLSYCKYPPAGVRGTSPFTKSFGFINDSIEEKKDKLNSVKVSLLIEGGAGFEALESILERYSDQLNMIYFGFYDFAASYQLKPTWDDEMVARMSEFIEKVKKFSVQVGTIATEEAEVLKLHELGVDYIVYLNDLGILRRANINLCELV